MRMRPAIVIVSLILGLSVPPAASATQTPTASPRTAATTWQITEVREIELPTLYPTSHPVLSPDGWWLAGVDEEHSFCIWDIATLTPTCAGERLRIDLGSIAWAPDSTAVAFTLDAILGAEESDLFIYDLGTGALTNRTDDGVAGRLLTEAVISEALIDTLPTWSPDSQHLAFVRSVHRDDLDTTTLMRIARSGGEPTEILRLDVDQAFAVWLPLTWLPDDTLLYTVIARDPREAAALDGVWQVGVDGADPRQVVPGNAEAEIPVALVGDVDPAGTTALVYSFSLLREFMFGLDRPLFWLVDLADGTREPIPAPPGDGPEPARVIGATFSPDGESVLLVTMVPGLGWGLAVLDVATREITVLPGEPIEPFRPGAPQWAANDTVLRPHPHGAILIALERTS
jgi:WD40 repeat protein